jgi:uncharacterized protein YabN with tetrapyrrole methylase and pyrophosphatase domain
MSGEETAFSRLVHLARVLRGEGGCPWDRAQDLASLARYVLGEAEELCEAARADDTDHVREEIGDVLFILIGMAVLAEDEGYFSLQELLKEVEAKMVRRHPHVFGNATAETAEEARQRYGEAKSAEAHGADEREEVK